MKASKRARIYERDGHACVKCGVTDDLTIDHIIPIARGGNVNYCFCECPIYLVDHPELARSLKATPSRTIR